MTYLRFRPPRSDASLVEVADASTLIHLDRIDFSPWARRAEQFRSHILDASSVRLVQNNSAGIEILAKTVIPRESNWNIQSLTLFHAAFLNGLRRQEYHETETKTDRSGRRGFGRWRVPGDIAVVL
ncbi:MAG TPA: hypothetical protein VHH73_17650 [Verrucomicrobiae bacterium]|nr:hypothetical protein [Verrucomicrobiae bacterium]